MRVVGGSWRGRRLSAPEGKAVHGAKLATSNTAMIAALARRLGKLEEGKRK